MKRLRIGLEGLAFGESPCNNGLMHDASSGHPMAPAKDVIRAHGLRCTKQRVLLYDALRASKVHPTAEQLFESVHSADNSVSLATVYNALEALSDAGLVRRVPSRRGNGPCRYDADVRPHVHIVTPDGRLLDLPDEVSEEILGAIPPEVIKRIEREIGVPIQGVNIELLAGG